MKYLIRYWPVRFLIDFWIDGPRRALRHYTRKRTWPSPKEFAAMTDDEFSAYLDWVAPDALKERAA